MFVNARKSDTFSAKIVLVAGFATLLIPALSCYDFARRYVFDAASPAAPQHIPAQTKISVEPIINIPFFGQPDASDIARDAQPTSLQLELKGVIASPRNDESGAIIAEPGKPEKIYHSGDMVLGDTKIVAVFPDRVLFYRNEKYEVLNFKPADAGIVKNMDDEKHKQ